MKSISLAYLFCLLFCCQAAFAATPDKQTLPKLDRPFMAPDFSLPSEDGKTYHLADFRGKLVVINFWATWCPPCRREMPSLQRMWKRLKGKGVQVLAINVGEDADTIFEFLGSYPLSFPLLMDRDGSVVKQYRVTGLPTTYIVNPQGQVVRRAMGGREWDAPALYKQLLKLRKE